MRRLFIIPVAVAGAVAAQPPATSTGAAQQPPTAVSFNAHPRPSITELKPLPLVFEPNIGQAPPGTDFISRYGSRTILLSSRETIVLAAPRRERSPRVGRVPVPQPQPIRMRFPGSRQVSGEVADKLPGETHYIMGSAARSTTAAQYGSVIYRSLYAGIDLVYRSSAGRLEHDFVVSPGADPASVRIAFPGAHTSLNSTGDLAIRSGRGRLIEKLPVVYQDTPAGRRLIPGGYRRTSHGQYGFRIGEYDPSLPLVIDPETIVSAAYLGGSGDDSIAALTEAGGFIYLTGQTASPNFPGTNGFLPRAGAPPNAFVTKMDSAMTKILWTSVFGGSGTEAGFHLSVDSLGQTLVIGYTTSPDFPLVNAIQSQMKGTEDMFISKLNASGTGMVFSTYFGGSGQELPVGATWDPAGNAIFCGFTNSTDFPTASPASTQVFQTRFGGGTSDGFVAKFSPTGQLLGSTYLGGAGADSCNDIVYGGGSLFLTGSTTSTSGFPITSNAWQKTLNGPANGFVMQMTPDLSRVVVSSLFGGSGNDSPNRIAVSLNLDVIIAGQTSSQTLFPAVPAFPVTYHGGPSDAFYGFFQFNPVLYPNPAILQTGLIGGTQNDLVYTMAPMQSPGGSFFGVRLFGETDSTITSNLTGFPNCNAASSLLFVDIPFFTNSIRQGCLGPGAFNAVYDEGRSVLLAADVRSSIVQPTTPFTYAAGSDGLILRKSGFDDPMRFDGNVGIDQVSFTYPNATLLHSSTGSLWIDVPGLSTTLGQPFGYLNVSVPGLGWVGQNIRWDVNDGIQFLRTPILLRDPTLPNLPLTSETVRIQVTPDPLIIDDPSLPAAIVPVMNLMINAQGVGPLVTVPPPPPAKDRAFTPAGDTYSHILPRSDINQQTAQSQCAPMSYANSLAYLASQHDSFKLPNPHQPGLNGDNTLVGQLDALMGRSAPSRTQGGGLFEQDQLKGKFQYLKQNGLDGMLVHKYQGPLFKSDGLSSTTSDFTSSGITATNQGATVTFDWLCGEIQNGEDVEMMYEWSTGGHGVRVFGCGKTRGTPWIKYLDDGNQTGQSDPTDTLGIETVHAWVGDLTGTGQLNMDNIGQTVRAAISESFTPAVKASPGASPLTSRNALTNGASFVVDYVSKGSAAALFGLFQQVATQGTQEAPHGASAGLPTDIGGTEVLINGAAVPLYFVTNSQINFQIPSDIGTNEATVVVRQGTKQSAAFTITISPTAPGIFILDPSIAGPDRGAIQNQDFTVNLPSNPAKPGQAVVVYVTGLGPTDIAVSTGQPAPNPPARALANVTATIGGQPAIVFFAGLTPGFVGLGQVNMIVPNLPPGDYPVVITAGNNVSNQALVTVGQP